MGRERGVAEEDWGGGARAWFRVCLRQGGGAVGARIRFTGWHTFVDGLCFTLGKENDSGATVTLSLSFSEGCFMPRATVGEKQGFADGFLYRRLRSRQSISLPRVRRCRQSGSRNRYLFRELTLPTFSYGQRKFYREPYFRPSAKHPTLGIDPVSSSARYLNFQSNISIGS